MDSTESIFNWRKRDRMIKKMHWEAFSDGYKPAILLKRTAKFFPKVSGFPFIQPFNSLDPDGCIIFRSENQKEAYQQQIKSVVEDTYQWHYIVGQTLGYPEKSVEWFSHVFADKKKTGKDNGDIALFGVGVVWAGFFFKTNVKYLSEEIQVLWNRYQHPKAVENPLYLRTDTGYIEISYGDLEHVRRVQRNVMRQRGLVISVNR